MSRFLDRARSYALQSREVLRETPTTGNLVALLGYFPRWYISLAGRQTPFTTEQPWLTYAAIHCLDTILKPGMRVFEYGSGGSTLYFARRVAAVVSIEHDPGWAEKTAAALQAHGYKHCELRLIQPVRSPKDRAGDASDPDSYASADEHFDGFSFLDYVSSLDAYPDQYFDLVCIDGRARPACFKHALRKVAPGGHIVWDNTERDYYLPAMQLANKHFRRTDFPGPIPGLPDFIRTTIFQRCADDRHV